MSLTGRLNAKAVVLTVGHGGALKLNLVRLCYTGLLFYPCPRVCISEKAALISRKGA